MTANVWAYYPENGMFIRPASKRKTHRSNLYFAAGARISAIRHHVSGPCPLLAGSRTQERTVRKL